MGKKSRRQRQKRPASPAGDFPQYNKVITPDTKVPQWQAALMKGTIRKHHAVYTLMNNQTLILHLASVMALPSMWARGEYMQDTPREYIDAVAPLFESHKVQPKALRILGTEREYSYTEAEWTGYRRAWGMRVSIAARHLRIKRP